MVVGRSTQLRNLRNVALLECTGPLDGIANVDPRAGPSGRPSPLAAMTEAVVLQRKHGATTEGCRGHEVNAVAASCP